MSQRIAIVTGGSRGLGRETALAFAARGVDTIITYQTNKNAADAVVTEIQKRGRKAVALQLDAGKVASFEAFAFTVKEALQSNWSRSSFDYLINNAGQGAHAAFASTDEATFDALCNVHFKGVFFLTQRLAPMIENGGRVINLSSGLTRFTYPGYAAYASMKGAIEVLTHYLAKELGERKIAVNTVAPGAIATDFGGGAVRDNAQLNAMIASQTALGRVGVPEDIGPLVASMCSEETRWINGQRIEASGGITL
jgi:NAD(P)-dependent dehydrogenase (short-subunit alcohol dehydrogenase family)